MAVGVHLTILMGPSVPLPLNPTLLEALQSVSVGYYQKSDSWRPTGSLIVSSSAQAGACWVTAKATPQVVRMSRLRV